MGDSENEVVQQFDENIEGSFVNFLAQTLGFANKYLIALLNKEGLCHLVPSHGDILVMLFSQKRLSMQALADGIHRDPSTVTALVKKLADAGYVSTHKSTVDRRKTEVSLTTEGERLQDSFDEISKQLVEAQMDGISKKDFLYACGVLKDIQENFKRSLAELQSEKSLRKAV